MIKMTLKYLWAQRRNNALLFIELVVVGILLFYVTDSFLESYRTYLIPTGFDTQRSYVIQIEGTTDNKIGGRELKENLDRFLRTRTEIEKFAYTFYSEPFSGSMNSSPLVVNKVEVNINIRESDARFSVLFNIPIVMGRWFTDGEMLQNQKVCVITQSLANILNIRNPIGTSLHFNAVNLSDLKITGVIPDLKYSTYEYPAPTVFRPMDLQYIASGCRVIVKVKKGGEDAFTKTLKLLNNEVSQSLNIVIGGVTDFDTLREYVDLGKDNTLSTMFWCVLFFLVNVVLGIYVVFSGRIKKRVQELGLRMAVGSSQMGIIGLVLGEATMLLLLSSIPVLVVGANLAYFGMLSPDSSLTVSRFVTVFLLTELILLVSVLFSVLLPAVRASKVQPAEALHYE